MRRAESSISRPAETGACAHCLLPLAPGAAVRGDADARDLLFCCTGCRNVHALLTREGLDGFYARRTGWTPGPPGTAAGGTGPGDPEAFADCTRPSGGALEADMAVSGIRCASCVWLIERYLGKKAGILSARVNYATHRATVRWDPAAADAARIAGWIGELGYGAHPVAPGGADDALRREKNDLLVRFGTAAFLSSQVMMVTAGLYAGMFQGIEGRYRTYFNLLAFFLTTPIVFYAGFPFLKGAAAGIRNLAPGMDVLVGLGTLSAYAYSAAMVAMGRDGYWDTAAMIVTLVLLGRYLEASARGRASASLAALVRLAPGQARRLRAAGGPPLPSAETVPVGALAPGDSIEIVPGSRIPADGCVTAGSSEADESMLTGESRPVVKGPGSPVYAGTLNGPGRLVVAVTGTARETVLARIVRAVAEAQARKAPIQGIADAVVRRFVPAVVAAAALTFAAWLASGRPAAAALLASVAVLVVACPCALGLAVPLAVHVGAGAARSAGILVKGGDVLEAGARVTSVFLDKTGTLTEGRPRLTDAVEFGVARDELLGIAASLEASSEHAFAGAVLRAAPGGPRAEVAGFRATPGMGVEGTIGGRRCLLGREEFLAARSVAIPPEQREVGVAMAEAGKTVAWLALEGTVAGVLAAVDTVRPAAPGLVARLREDGYGVMMVTGDGESVAARIAKDAGLDRFRAGAAPAEKAAAVREAKGSGARVLFVGDGVNDAPAMAEADVGMAMGRGTDVAIESAGIVLTTDDLALVRRFLLVSRRTMRVVRQNLWWAFSYNAVAIPLAAAGRITPIVSAGLMAASSLIVTGNALRLRERAPAEPGD
ncbi:MAG: heavy metal translocating P-type ATPase [Gemmatimonadota bacterium]